MDAPAGPAPLLKALQGVWQDLPGLVSDRVELLALEVQQAGRALAQIAGLVVAVAVLAVTAWLLLWAGLVAGAVALGLHLAWALGLAMLLNGVAAALALVRMKSLSAVAQLPATRRHLRPAILSPQPKPPAHTHERPDPSPNPSPAPSARHPSTAASQPVAP